MIAILCNPRAARLKALPVSEKAPDQLLTPFQVSHCSQAVKTEISARYQLFAQFTRRPDSGSALPGFQNASTTHRISIFHHSRPGADGFRPVSFTGAEMSDC